MSTRREIVVSGRDAGLGTLMDKLRRSSSDLGRSLIEESLQNSKTSKDALRYYEEQIRLIERRNKVYTEGLRQQATEKYASDKSAGVGRQAKDHYSKSIEEITRGSKEDQLQVQLLRELIETVKVTSLQEVRSETSDSQSKANLITRITQSHGTEAGQLSRRILAESGKPIASNSNYSLDNIGSSLQGAGGVMGQRSFLGAGAQGLNSMSAIGGGIGVMGKMGVIGMALAAIKGATDIPRTIRGGRETSLSEYAALSGGDVSSLEDRGLGRTNKGQYGSLDLNITREEFVKNWLPQIIKARGTVAQGEAIAFRGMELMRGGAVDQGTIMGAARYGRTNGTDATDMASQIYAIMGKGRAFGKDGQDFNRMSSLLGTLVQLQEGQMMSSGSIGGSANLNLLNRFGNLGGAFSREDYTASTITSLNSGLRSGGAPEGQAMKFDVLRRLNPNKSFFELQAEMEKGVDSKGFLEGMMKMVQGTGGNQDSQMILFDQLTGGQLKKNDILKMFQGGVSFEDLEKKGEGGNFETMMRGRAKRASSKVQTDVDFESEAMADVASSAGTAIQDFIDVIKDKTARLSLLGMGDVPPPMTSMAGLPNPAYLLYVARQAISGNSNF